MIKVIAASLFLLFFSVSSLAATYNTSIRGDFNYSNTKSAINTLKKARKGDTVNLYVNSYGGETTYFQRLKAHLNGERLVVKVDRVACSAGAYTLMLANKRVVSPSALVMFHTGYIVMGNGQEVKASVYSSNPLARSFGLQAMREMSSYRWLFTSSEWEKLRRGEDVRISGSRL